MVQFFSRFESQISLLLLGTNLPTCYSNVFIFHIVVVQIIIVRLVAISRSVYGGRCRRLHANVNILVSENFDFWIKHYRNTIPPWLYIFFPCYFRMFSKSPTQWEEISDFGTSRIPHQILAREQRMQYQSKMFAKACERNFLIQNRSAPFFTWTLNHQCDFSQK